jgi:hypothetical protein
VIVNPANDSEIAPLEALLVVKIDREFAGKEFRYVIFLDGRPVQARWDPDALAFTYFPERMLRPGDHLVQVYLNENENKDNRLLAESRFKVKGQIRPLPPLEGSIFDIGARRPAPLEAPSPSQPPQPAGGAGAGFFQLSGRASMDVRQSDFDGFGSGFRQEPDNISVFDLSGRGKSGETDFDFRFYLTTDENKFDQPRNRYQFKVEGENYGLAVGDSIPRLGELLIDGMRIRGFHGWGTMGPVTVDFAEGEARRSTETKYDENGDPVTRGIGGRRIWIARVGLWDTDPFSLGFSYLSGKEKPSDSPIYGSPGENAVRSIDATVRFGGDDGSLHGVYAESDFNFVDPEKQDVSGATARQLEASYTTGGHTLKVHWEAVEPGFVSLGLPYIQTDRQGWGVEDRVNAYQGALSGRVYWEQYENNVDSSAPLTTTTTRYGAQMQYRFDLNGPYLRAGYLAQNRSNDAGTGGAGLIDQSSSSVNLGLSQTFNFWGGRHSIRADWRRSSNRDEIIPSGNSNQRGVTLSLTSRWTSGFQLDVMASNSVSSFPARGFASHNDRYSVRAGYTPGDSHMGFWARYEDVRSRGDLPSQNSNRDTLELGMRWDLGGDLTLEASMAIVDYEDKDNDADDFDERMYRMILTQMLR